MSKRETGTLKFFDSDRGFGFIERKGGEDVFLHIRESFHDEDRPDSSQLEGGMRIEFAVVTKEKGPQARGAHVITDPFQVPRDTAPLFEAHREKTPNLALRVEKAASFKDGDTPDIPNDFSFSQFKDERILRRHDAHLEAIRQRPGVQVETVNAAVDWRLAVGLGRASVYENGITLDATDGIPYVPGSGVKGALRTFLINAVYRPELADPTADGEAEAKALSDPVFCDVFGTSEEEDSHYDEARQGSVTFYDAYPKPSPTPRVETDIMNAHFQEYYQQGDAPTDDMDPNIITFLTVTEARFPFVVSTRENPDPQDGTLTSATPPAHRGSRLDMVAYWLRGLLTEHGLGAKTAAGYGFFVLP